MAHVIVSSTLLLLATSAVNPNVDSLNDTEAVMAAPKEYSMEAPSRQLPQELTDINSCSLRSVSGLRYQGLMSSQSIFGAFRSRSQRP
ncbi:hypothetical protein EDD22DRAFT_865444 [Suillus occidentalis]|nr:hypothetical protein EDD22DRAFT_865444 [Suillus occidentalis]